MNEVDPGLVALLILAPMALAMVAQCYVAHKYTERFESLLIHCAFITNNKNAFQHRGLPGKLMRTGLISLVLATPKIFVRRGLIDVREVQRFPLRSKQLLVGLLGIHVVLFTALIIFHHALPL
ncbi:hypothetical protein [Pseudomonas sp. nanlin1]|uniref:hypothetical protein n=1 Tax=Pseudomonas sp. nanlin1 TaxID=3040605 RepID=UPI00388DB0EF